MGTLVESNLNWGTELWDQYDNLSVHTMKGIDFLEKYGHFVKDRAKIETEYASSLRKLVKNYQPKKKEEDDLQFTTSKAFTNLMNEINDLAGQHELVAENLQDNVIRELTVLVKDLKDERKKHLEEGQKLSQALQNQIAMLQRSKKAYDKAFRDAEKAIETYQKADADFNLSRADVEKTRQNMTQKTQACDQAKNEYAVQLQKTNEMQRTHYRTGLPEVFWQLQHLDENRIKNIKNFIVKSVEIEKNVFPIIAKCLEGILKAADIINEKEDSMLVIEKYKSGFEPPEDYPFEDLSKGGSDNGSVHSISNKQSFKNKNKETLRGDPGGTVINRLTKGRNGIFNIKWGSKTDDLSDLPPNQRRKKLNQKVEELKTKVAQETAARDGLMKMKGVYETNPALGDPRTIESQLNDCNHKLEKLQLDLHKFQGYLDEAVKGVSSTNNSIAGSPRLINGGAHKHRHSGGSAAEDSSLSRSGSESSVHHHNNSHSNNKRSAPGTPQLNNHGCSNSPESGIGESHTSLQGADSDHDHDHYDGAADEEYGEPLPVIGTCQALYPFEATSEGSMSISQDEELDLIELDQGDGWTRVRRRNHEEFEEGFVPTSYIQTTLYAD